MAESRLVAIDPRKAIDINIVGQSPHVFVYRCWYREPGADSWSKIADGDTRDDIPDHVSTGPHAAGTQIAWWVLVGGRKNSSYKFLITLGQAGQNVQGGTILEGGRTGEDGGAARLIKVVLV
jgi:hypothetical protein